MQVNKYTNRYGDVFTFTEDDSHDILWEGNFQYCRIGMPNDYTKAYNQYLKDNEHNQSLITFEQFQSVVHDYDDETHTYVYDKYVRMIESLNNEIEMVDPSGGCYISRGMSLDFIGYKNYIVQDFEKIETGYKIITIKCPKCHKAGGIHKISCVTTKIQIHL